MQFFRTPTPNPNLSNALCLGCKTRSGAAVSLQDYDVETAEDVVGASFGKKIVQIVNMFRVKKNSVMQRLREEWNAQQPGHQIDYGQVPPVETKSIVMESSAGLYRELYFIVDDCVYSRPLSKAHVLAAGAAHILATDDAVSGNGAYCTDGYWTLDPAGPWLLDFTAVDHAIQKLTPADATATQTRCWALSMEKLEVRSPVQRKDAECRACGWLGTAVVHFSIDGHRAVPVSSMFEREPAR